MMIDGDRGGKNSEIRGKDGDGEDQKFGRKG